MGVVRLGQTIQMLFEQALAPATRRSYSAAQRRFLTFCKNHALAPLPLNESLLCHFVAFLYEEGLAHTTVKSYLSALRQLQIKFNLPDPFASSMPRLEQVVRGVKVMRGKQGMNASRQKLPITPRILRQMAGMWQKDQADPTYIMLWAACSVCFLWFF